MQLNKKSKLYTVKKYEYLSFVIDDNKLLQKKKKWDGVIF